MAASEEGRRMQRRVNTLLRDRDAIRRMLEQANLDRVAREVGRQSVSIERVERELGGES